MNQKKDLLITQTNNSVSFGHDYLMSALLVVEIVNRFYKNISYFSYEQKKLKEKTYLSPEKHLSVGWACLPRVAIEDRKYLTILKNSFFYLQRNAGDRVISIK